MHPPRVVASSRGMAGCEHRAATPPPRCDAQNKSPPTTSKKSPRNHCSGGSNCTDKDDLRREQQVQALLRGDLSVIEEPLRALHEKVAAHRMVLSSRAGPCPEYEHFRATMDTRWRRRADGEWSHTSSTMAVTGESDSVGQRSSLRTEEQQQQQTLQHLETIKEPSRPEYQRFRLKMREKQGKMRERSMDDSGLYAGSAQQSEGERSATAAAVATAASGDSRCENGSLPSLVDDSFLQHQYHHGLAIDSPKRLGEVRELLGTVLGKAPPSSSPFHFASSSKSNNSGTTFSDTESIELVFE